MLGWAIFLVHFVRAVRQASSKRLDGALATSTSLVQPAATGVAKLSAANASGRCTSYPRGSMGLNVGAAGQIGHVMEMRAESRISCIERRA